MGAVATAKPQEKKSKASATAVTAVDDPQFQIAAGSPAGLPLFLDIRLQKKLAVGGADDPLEKEADRIADAAVSDSRSTDQPHIHRVSPIFSTFTPAIPVANSGSPMDTAVRSRAESALEADLAHVRIHSSPADREVARGLGAKAFTHGSDIWLGPNQSSADTRLMTHEAAHVVQQGGGKNTTISIQREPEENSSAPETETATGPVAPSRDGEVVLQKAMRKLSKPANKESGETKGPELEREGKPASPRTAPGAAAEKPNPAEMAKKKAELEPEVKPPVDRAAAAKPRVDQAAGKVKREAEKPPKSAKGAKKASGAKEKGPSKVVKEHAEEAAALATRAFAEAKAVPMPDLPPSVNLPKPVLPVDAGGKPLPTDPRAETQIRGLAGAVQILRAQGTALRQRAAQERGNASVIRGNMRLVQGGIAQAEGGVAHSEEHLAYRRQVTGQAKGALQISEQKAEKVAAEAPKYAAKGDEGKQKSGPMASESKDLSSRNAKATPDDPDAAARSQEQGQKLNKVGSDIGSMDDAITQTKAKAEGLSEEAAQAKKSNTQTQEKIASTESTLAKTETKLNQMKGQNATARARIAGLAGGPSEVQAGADSLDQRGLQLVQSSFALEQQLHKAQQTHEAGMRSVPASKRRASGNGGGPPVLIQRQAEPGARVNLNLAGKLQDVAPSWLTGEEKQTEAQRAEAQAKEQKRHQDEIAEINGQAKGDFNNLTAGDKAGIALSLTTRHLFNSVGGTNWPNFGAQILRGLVDPRVALMGIVSGLSMTLSGAANLLSAEQWKKDPLGNLLKSAADIATGITIVLGAITALAMAIIVILVAAAILTLGALGPVAAVVIPFCGTIVSTVGPWTITAAEIALVLQALVFIKDLIDAATASSAAELQKQSDAMTEDAKNAGNMAMQIGMASVGEVAGEAIASTEFGQAIGAEMKGIGEEFGIIKPEGGPPTPPVGEAPPVTTAEAPTAPPSAPAPEAATPPQPAAPPTVEAPAAPPPAAAAEAAAPPKLGATSTEAPPSAPPPSGAPPSPGAPPRMGTVSAGPEGIVEHPVSTPTVETAPSGRGRLPSEFSAEPEIPEPVAEPSAPRGSTGEEISDVFGQETGTTPDVERGAGVSPSDPDVLNVPEGEQAAEALELRDEFGERKPWEPPPGAAPKPPIDAPQNVRLDWVRERLQMHVDEAIGQYEIEGLTGPQEAAVAEHPGLLEPFRGSRIDAFAKDIIMQDPELAEMITAPDFISEPDILSAELPDWFDITTMQQWAAHVTKYGPRYGTAGHLLPTR